VSGKFIPNGDLDFAARAEAFARTLLAGRIKGDER
jgi:hypothetical protein